MSRKPYSVARFDDTVTRKRPVNFGHVHDVLIDSEFDEKNLWLKVIIPISQQVSVRATVATVPKNNIKLIIRLKEILPISQQI